MIVVGIYAVLIRNISGAADIAGAIWGCMGYTLSLIHISCASRYAGCYVVTLSVDQVIFREPVHVGELVTFLASVNHTGRTSICLLYT